MTTPVPPYNLSTPDGAVTVGGGSWNYGQTITEETHRAGFELPQPTPDNMLDLLRVALEQLPKDAMGPWAGFLGLAEGFLDAADAAGQIIDALIVKPVVQTVEAFGLWVAQFFEGFAPGLGTSINAFIDWFNGNVMSPLATWISNVQTFFAQLWGTPEQVVGNIFNVIADGVATVGDFFNGVWNTLTGGFQSNTKISEVNSAFGMLNSTATTAGSNAVTAQVMADVAQLAADAAQADASTAITNASIAQAEAEIGNNLVRSKIAAGDNFATNPGFDNAEMFLGSANVTRSDESPRTDTHSAKVVMVNGEYSFVYPVAVNNGHLRVPCSEGDVFYFEFWCKGLSTNQSAPGQSLWMQCTALQAGGGSTSVASGFGSLNGSHNDDWHFVYGSLTMPANTYGATFYLVFPNAVPTGNTYYIDDVRLLRVTEAEAAKLLADAAQALANTAQSNAETAQSKADSAFDIVGELISNLLNAPGMVLGSLFNAVIDGIQTVGEWLGGLWAAFMGAVNPGPKTSAEVTQAASAVKADTDTNAANVVVAQVTATTANTVAKTVLEAGPNLVTDPSFESSEDLLSGYNVSTEQARTGNKSLKFASTGEAWGYNLFRGTTSYYIKVSPGDVFAVEYWVYGKSSNTYNSSSLYGRVEMAVRNASGQTLSWERVRFYPSTSWNGKWTKVSGTITMPADAAEGLLKFYIPAGFPAGETYYFDDVQCYRITEAFAAEQDAAAAQSTANTGVANAATADSKAVAAAASAAAADVKAVNADDKAQLANDIHVGRSAGPNIVLSPNFEDSSVERILIGNPAEAYYTTSLPYSGTRCFFLRHDGGGGWNGMYLSPSPGNGYGGAARYRIPVNPGEVYQARIWCRPNGSNDYSAGTVALYLRWRENMDGGAFTDDFTSIGATTNMVPGQWQELEVTGTCPANRCALEVICVATSQTPAGNTFRFDNASVREIRNASEAQTSADLAQADANTGITNAATADAKALAAQQAADAADAAAAKAKSILKSVVESGNNICVNPSFENTDFALNTTANEYSTTVARSGSRSMRLVGTGGYVTQGLVGDESTAGLYVPAAETDVWWVQFYVMRYTGGNNAGIVGVSLRCRDKDGNTAGYKSLYVNADTLPYQEWVEVSGYVTAAAGTVDFHPYLQLWNSIPSGIAYHFDDVKIIRATEAYAAQLEADAAAAEAATAKSNAAIADGKAQTAQNAANTADGKAVAAQNAANTADGKAVAAQNSANTADSKAVVAQDMSADLASRQNMVYSPNFEDSSVERHPIGTPNQLYYTTSVPYSGTRCLYFKYGNIGDGWQGIYLTSLPRYYPGYQVTYSCKPGETYEAKIFVRPDGGNDQNTDGYTRLAIRFRTSSAGGGDYWYVNEWHDDDVTAKATWHEYKVVGTCPDHVSSVDGKRFSYFDVLFIASNVATGNVYRLDNASVREITNAQVAQDSADTAQNRADTAYSNAGTADTKAVLAREAIDLKAKDFGNLLAGSDFETAAHGWALPASGFGTGYVLSSSQANTGSKSLKLENPGSNYSRLNYTGTSNPNDAPAFFETKPGEQFLMECYAQRSGNYTYNGGDPRLRLIREAGDANVGWTIDDLRFPAANFPASYTWYKFSKIITIPDDNTTLVSVAWQSPPPGMVGSIWVDDIVLRRIINPALVNGLPNDISVEDTLLQHTAEISDLKAAREVTVNQGKTISVNFTTLANASSLPTTGSQRWTTTYSGSGSATFGIVSGKAAWTGNSGSREAKVIYNGDGGTASATTLTDYQTLRGVLGNPPINSPFTAIARANSTNPNTYVWAEAVATVGFGISVTGKIGAVVNGTNINWVTGIPLTWSTEMTLKCGVDGDPRRYQVFSGTTLVMDYKEDTRQIIAGTGTQVRPSGAALSGLGSGYRRWGAIARYDGFANSGTVSSVTVSDDPPVIYAGSVARMSRSGTGNTGTIDTTLRAIPSNFFDDVDFESLDIDGNTSDGTFTVSKSKMYAISARVLLSSYTDANSFLGLQVYNGSSWATTQYGPTLWGADTGFNAINPASGFALSGSFLQYLEAGEKVRLVYKQDRGSRTNILTGGGGGAETYFTISGMG